MSIRQGTGSAAIGRAASAPWLSIPERYPGSSSAQRLQLAFQRIGPLRDVAGAEQDHVVAGLGKALHDCRELRLARQRKNLPMAAGAHRGDEVIAVNALDRRLTGRIDL